MGDLSMAEVGAIAGLSAHLLEARKFADFLTGPEGRTAIARFGKDRFGQPLLCVVDPAR